MHEPHAYLFTFFDLCTATTCGGICLFLPAFFFFFLNEWQRSSKIMLVMVAKQKSLNASACHLLDVLLTFSLVG